MEDLKNFLRHFKTEVERWLGLLELGCEHKEETESGGLHDGVEGGKAQCENRLKLKAQMFTDTRVREPTCVYTRRSPRKVTT